MIPSLNNIKEISEGDISFEKKIIEILKNEFPIEKEEFFNYLKKNDYQKCASIVHKIRHKINLLSFDKGAETALNFEKELKNNNYSSKSEFITLLNVIDQYLKTI